MQTTCAQQGSTFNEQCGNLLLVSLGIDPALVNGCIANSGGVTPGSGGGENTILKQEIADANALSIFTIPFIFINRVRAAFYYSVITHILSVFAGYRPRILAQLTVPRIHCKWVAVVLYK